jgi:hypothetical protein
LQKPLSAALFVPVPLRYNGAPRARALEPPRPNANSPAPPSRQAALGTAFRQVVAGASGPIKNVATAAESWAVKGPALEADIAALSKAAEGGMVVGDLKHLAFRAAEFYGYFCIGEMIGRGNVYGYFL